MPVSSRSRTLDIMVLGLPETGKTTFIDTISQNARTGQPHGWHAGDFSLNPDLNLRFLEPPAAYVFDDSRMRELIARGQAAGYIILCDSTMPDRFGRMASILAALHDLQPDAPTIIAANKQDHVQAWAVEDIRLALDVPNQIAIIPCAAGNTNSVTGAVGQLARDLR